jgi:molybdopterin-binding protein
MLEIKQLSLNVDGFSLGPLNFSVYAGEHMVVLGPSGSGKSLILEIIAGFRKPDTGRIILNNKELTGLLPHKRPVGMVFQRPALFQHLSVYQNILYPLKEKGGSRKAMNEKVEQLAAKFHIAEILFRKPASLSGGEAQRVSLARTLAMNPSILLLDEPLSSLDVQLRAEIRDYLDTLNNEGMTMIHVTHDVSEAFRRSRRIAAIKNGKIVQQGMIEDLLVKPNDDFIARLLGIRNFYPVEVIHSNSSQLTHVLVKKILIKTIAEPYGNKGFIRIDENQILISTEKVQLSAQNILKARVVKMIPSINGIDVELDAGFQLFSRISNTAVETLGIYEGAKVYAVFKLAAVSFFE